MIERAKRFTNLGGARVMGSESSRDDAARSLANVSELEVSFAERKRFTCLRDDDAALLAELRPAFEAAADEVVERFYDHLMSIEHLQALLSDPDRVVRLKQAQREYLLSLASGRYGEAYAESRLRIGQVHERIGLEPQWYLGTYGLYTEMLMPHVHRHFVDDPARGIRAAAALSKLLVLDMQIVLDAYYETRHRKALRRSEELAAVGELAASIAHEVRNPLAGMKGALEVLRSELAVKPSNLEIVDELLAQIVRLETLVRDLLTFARPSTPSHSEFDLQELLDRLVRIFKDEAESCGITVHRIYGPGTSRVVADVQQMEQVFLNLIHNAFQSMESGGTLTLSTQTTRGGIVVSFQDTGNGIDPVHISRIFQPFFTTKHRGSGLGLPIVKKIISAHGGTITVSSRTGEGTTATLMLPHQGAD